MTRPKKQVVVSVIINLLRILFQYRIVERSVAGFKELARCVDFIGSTRPIGDFISPGGGSVGVVDASGTLSELTLYRMKAIDLIDGVGRAERNIHLTAFGSFFGRDDYHTVSRPRTPKSRRRRPFQDLHRSDVIGVDVVEARLRYHAARRTSLGGVADGYPVQHDQRLRIARQRVLAANLDERSRPGIARRTGNLYPRSFAGQTVDDTRFARAGQRLTVYFGTRRAQLVCRLLNPQCCYDHLVEHSGVGSQAYVESGAAANLDFLRHVANE